MQEIKIVLNDNLIEIIKALCDVNQSSFNDEIVILIENGVDELRLIAMTTPKGTFLLNRGVAYNISSIESLYHHCAKVIVDRYLSESDKDYIHSIIESNCESGNYIGDVDILIESLLVNWNVDRWGEEG